MTDLTFGLDAATLAQSGAEPTADYFDVHPAHPGREAYKTWCAPLASGTAAIVISRYGTIREVWAFPDLATARLELVAWVASGGPCPMGFLTVLADRVPFAAGLHGFFRGATEAWKA